MKIKIVVNGKSFEIELTEDKVRYFFNFNQKPDQLIEFIGKTIQELKA